MKALPVIIGIVIILTLVCSPVLAIGKSDLIASYKGQSLPTKPTPTPTPSYETETTYFDPNATIGAVFPLMELYLNGCSELVRVVLVAKYNYLYQEGLLDNSSFILPCTRLGW